MALTLVEAMKGTNDPLRSGVIEVFARTSPVLERASIQQVVGGAYVYTQEGELPGVAFRAVNEAYPESTGVLNPQVETMKIAGGDADVDKALIKQRPANSVGELRANQTRMKTKALSKAIEEAFFKGDTASNPKEFDGLQARLTGSQVIDAKGSTTAGDPLTLDKLDELIDLVDEVDVLFMNRFMRRKVNALRRAAGQARETVDDMFGRQIEAYAGIPIGVVDDNGAGNPILAFDESERDGSPGSTTSIYAVSWGEDEMTSMLETPPGIEVTDLGELDSAPVMRTRIEWIVGLAVFHGRAAARLRFLTQA